MEIGFWVGKQSLRAVSFQMVKRVSSRFPTMDLQMATTPQFGQTS
jgi:hypothetical protein